MGCLCNFNAKVIKDWGIIKKNHLFCCKLYASSYYKQMKGEFLTTAFKRIRARMRVANASDDDSEDALQDAFCRLWTRKEEIHGEKQAEGLLSVAARNIRIDKIRARSTHPSTSLEGVDILFQEKDEESAISETYREVSRLVEERLSSRDRDILFRRDRDGWDFDEIAEHFGISEANARMIVSRARKTIREIYKERRQS